MAKSTSSKSSPKKDKQAHKKQKRSRPPVQVVSCPTDFPTLQNSHSSSSSRKRQPQHYLQRDFASSSASKKDLLDWHDTSKEIRALGATAFVKQQKRQYENEMYKHLTGREKKHHKVPLPIVRGIKKKAKEREKQMLEEAKQAGIVLPKAPSTNKNQRRGSKDRESRIHGPAPSVGFMSKGILKINKRK